MLNKVEQPSIPMLSELDKVYISAVKSSTSLKKLKQVLEQYKPYAYDGWKQVQTLTWKQYLEGVKLSKKEDVESAEKANGMVGDILMPSVIFYTSYIALEYKVPWGVAFNRLLDVERIVWKKDHFELQNQD